MVVVGGGGVVVVGGGDGAPVSRASREDHSAHWIKGILTWVGHSSPFTNACEYPLDWIDV